MRKYLIPDGGQYWLSRDFASQELRVLAHYEDGAMMRAYNDDPNLDLHQMMSEILTQSLGRPIGRRVAKTIAFSILYGTGMAAMALNLGCSYDEAGLVKKVYLQNLPGIIAIQNSIKQTWGRGDAIKTWGDRYYYKEASRDIVDKRTGQTRYADFTYKGLNYLIQSSSADVTKQAIINYDSAKKDGRFLLSVHDQIDISAPLSEMKILREAMGDIKLDVPMISDGSFGSNMTTGEAYDDAGE
jgi:DNA polymerase-1